MIYYYGCLTVEAAVCNEVINERWTIVMEIYVHPISVVWGSSRNQRGFLFFGFQWFFFVCVCVFCGTHAQCCLLCDLRLMASSLRKEWDDVLRLLSQVHWKTCTMCAATRQKLQGFVSLNIAKTCANKYTNDLQLPRKLGYHECLRTAVLWDHRNPNTRVVLCLVLALCCV